ncbi:MAG TPA: protein kinase [Gemmataceae bacterium]|nr:protein kinase [Gemmataceae bacterium]
MNPDPKQVQAGARDADEADERLFALLDAYWEALLRGQAADPEQWLRGRPEAQGEVQNLRLLAAMHEARQMLNEDSRLEETTSEQPATVAEWTAGREASTQPLAQPQWIGKYRVVERLAGGGQAEVFRAVHPNLPGRDVVIKWAHQHLPPFVQQMLITEGGVLARLDDPGLVRVYDADVHEGRPFVVMEYVAGRTLQQQLNQERPTVRQAAALVAELAHTLAGVHRHGVYHRDLKPANVLIDAAGRLRLADFGLALMEESWGPPDRPEGFVAGTFQFMAPEQAEGRTNRIGPRTDVFGLGALLYALLTGRSPYQGADRKELQEQARQAKVVPPRQLNRAVPRPLERICLKALAADPERRYASASQLEAALRRYLRRRRSAAALAGLVLLGGSALGLHFGLPPHADQTAPPEAPAVLSGDLIVRVWSPGVDGKRGLPVDDVDRGALPVRNGESVHVEARLNQPGYVYLLWVDGRGAVDTLYPWSRDDDLRTPPPYQEPRQVVHSPAQEAKGWPVEGKSGLETVLLLARRTPLPAVVRLARVVDRLPPAPLRDPREVVVRGFDRDQPVDAIEFENHRGAGKEAAEIDDPLLRLMDRLRPHFDVIRAVRFAHRGD